MKILVITRHTPLPWEDGAGAYLFDIIRFLKSEGFQIHVAWLAPHDHIRWKGIWVVPRNLAKVATFHLPGALRIGRVEFFPAIYWLPFKARFLNRIKSVLIAMHCISKQIERGAWSGSGGTRHRGPEAWTATPSSPECEFAARVGSRVRPDAVIANYAWMTPLFEAVGCESSAWICLNHDVAWRRASLEAELNNVSPTITRRDEEELLDPANIIVGISASDALEFMEMAPNAQVVVAPKSFQPCPLPHGQEKRLLFVGSGNGFNAEGLSWFLREVWPLLRQAQPEVSMDVCGSVDRAVTTRPEGVAFHGAVPDITPYYGNAAVVVIPLLRATGLNIKLAEAAAYGRAIVTTPETLIGAPFLSAGVMTAADPLDFAKAVIRLLENRAERVAAGELAQAAVEANLNPEVCYGALPALMRSACNRGRSPRQKGVLTN